jgi:hypothetical protein
MVLSTYRWVIIIKGAAWTHFTIFEVHGNISDDQVRELKAELTSRDVSEKICPKEMT